MSYINDALHKVQKEQESPYAAYKDVVSAKSRKSGVAKKLFLAIGLLIIIVCGAAGAAMLFRTDFRHKSPVAVSAPSPVILTADLPQVIAETDNREKLDQLSPASSPLGAPLTAPSEKASLYANTPLAGSSKREQTAANSGNKLTKAASVDDPASLFAQALQKQRAGNLLAAKELYREVIKKEPHNIQALNNLGVVYIKLNRYKWAIVRLNDAIKIKHNYADAHYNLACLYAQKNDTKQSLFYLKNAIDFNPEARHWAAKDEDFQKIAALPQFKKIMQSRDE
jgi:tetratricopeptide (TPR) repeat protein